MSTPKKRGRADATPAKSTAEKKRKPEAIETETPSKKRRVTKLSPTRTVLENVDVFVWGSPDFFQCGPVHPNELKKPWPLYSRERSEEEIANKSKPPIFSCEAVLDLESNGYHNALLVLQKGKKVLYTWGCNDDAVLGRVTQLTEAEKAAITDGEKDLEDIRQCTPTPVDLEDVIQVAVGNHHMIVLTSDGSVWGWGIYKDDDGFIGFDPSVKDRDNKVFHPMLVPSLPKNIVAVASSANVSLALTETGRVWEWGCTGQRVQRRSGRLREHTLDYNQQQLNPHQLIFPAAVEEIYAGGDHHFAIDCNRQVYAWGINGWGQLGIGKKESKCQEKPKKVFALGKNVIQLACGATHSLALTSEGHVFSWGRGSYGQLGHGKKEKKVVINKNNYVAANKQSNMALLLFKTNPTETSTPAIETETTRFTFNSEPASDVSASGFVFGGSTPAAPATSSFTFGTTPNPEAAPSATTFVFDTSSSSATPAPANGATFTFGATVAEPTPVKADSDAAVFIFDKDKKEPEPEINESMDTEEQDDDFISTPQRIEFFEKLRADSGAKAVSIGAGCNHSIVITDDGKVYTFGFNEQSQLGLNHPEDQHTPEVFLPELVPFGKTYNARRATGGTDHTVLLASKK